MFSGQSGRGGRALAGPGRTRRWRYVHEALAGLSALPAGGATPHLGSIMLAALGVTAQADLATGAGRPADEARAAARDLLAVAERAAADGLPRGGTLGPEGRAWLCRARAELTRIEGRRPGRLERGGPGLRVRGRGVAIGATGDRGRRASRIRPTRSATGRPTRCCAGPRPG